MMQKFSLDTACVVIPAAGFGKRVGSPVAKELLLHPQTQKSMIDFSLNLCEMLNVKAIVISRFDKKELNNYIEDHKLYKKNITLCKIDASQEWPDTVLQSEKKWSQYNLLVLPDTEFQPLEIAKQLLHDLTEVTCSFACFATKDFQAWGMIQSEINKHDATQNKFLIAEKPKSLTPQTPHPQAWGLIAFQKNIGVNLFTTILQSNKDHEWHSLPLTHKIRQLDSFSDLTR